MRSAELTLPGFTHDVCSAIHPLAAASPVLPHAPARASTGSSGSSRRFALAHPLDDGAAAVLHRSVDETARRARSDERRYEALRTAPCASGAGSTSAARAALASRAIRWRWRASGSRRCAGARSRRGGTFDGGPARACSPGWPRTRSCRSRRSRTRLVRARARRRPDMPWAGRSPRGGSQRIADALASYLRSLGGEIQTGAPVESLAELAARTRPLRRRRRASSSGSRASVCRRLPEGLERFRYGPGVFKLDWALSGPIPWTAPACARAGTVHLGGTLEEIARLRARAGRRRDARAALRAGRAAEPVRRHTRPGRQSYRVGVLPRPERLDHRMTATIEARSSASRRGSGT